MGDGSGGLGHRLKFDEEGEPGRISCLAWKKMSYVGRREDD